MKTTRRGVHGALRLASASALLFAISSGLAASAKAQAAASDVPNRHDAEVRFGLERVRLPGDEHMGLLGISYLFEPRPGLFIGPAMYGAVSGQRGGLFTFGAEGAWRVPLAGRLSAQAGLYVGGGGGGSAPVGGGLMWRPHADLLWDFGGVQAGVSASQVRFSNGQISSRQLGLVFSAHTDFVYWESERARPTSAGPRRSGIGFDRLAAVAGVYKPRHDMRGVNGNPLKSTIGYVGARAEQLVAAPFYWGIEASGAGSGGVAGYAEFLATLGAESALSERIRWGGRVSLGMGGGGDVPVGGGLLAKAAVHGSVRLTRTARIMLEGGLARAPQGRFDARFAAVGVQWDLEANGEPAAVWQPARYEWGTGVETYRNAARRGGPSQHLQNVSFRFDRFLDHDATYLTGQVQSAWGGDAGGFSVGLVGAGYRWRPASSWLVGTELLVGVAGGGGVATGGGVIVKPMVYAGLQLTPAISARVGAGRVKSPQGQLDSPLVDVGLSFAFGAGQRH
jgi:hypothetical protein